MAAYVQRSAQLCSTSTSIQSGRNRRQTRKTGTRVFAAQEAFCKDKVNTVKEVVNVEGTARVSFLGAGGQEITIDCPKVRIDPPWKI
jgi:hypothetical protein